MIRYWRYTLLLLLPLLSAACATLPQQREEVYMPLGSDWQLARHYPLPGGYGITEFVPSGSTATDWHERVSVQSFPLSWAGQTPADAYAALRAERDQACPGTDWRVIEKSPDRIIYEWHSPQCSDSPAQHEIVSILDGQRNRYRITYASRDEHLPPQRRAHWVQVIESCAVRTSAAEP